MAHECILVVDDDTPSIMLISFVLLNAGYDVRTARDADGALAVIATTIPGLILMDVELRGEMDGLMLTRQLRREQRTFDIIIIGVSACSMKEDEQKALAAGCDGYIIKPFEARVLPGRVAGYLAKAEQQVQ